jgi:hypothetical protein
MSSPTATPIPPSAIGKSFDSLMEFLREPDIGPAALSPSRFSRLLGIDLQTLAAQAHVHRNTLTRSPASEGIQRFLREAVRVIRAATDLSGDVNRATFWYRNEPLAPFGYKTAETLVSEGRAEDVLRYVMSLEAGATG